MFLQESHHAVCSVSHVPAEKNAGEPPARTSHQFTASSLTRVSACVLPAPCSAFRRIHTSASIIPSFGCRLSLPGLYAPRMDVDICVVGDVSWISNSTDFVELKRRVTKLNRPRIPPDLATVMLLEMSAPEDRPRPNDPVGPQAHSLFALGHSEGLQRSQPPARAGLVAWRNPPRTRP
jgi:hypothetical protein